jgi:hypothetical protein
MFYLVCIRPSLSKIKIKHIFALKNIKNAWYDLTSLFYIHKNSKNIFACNVFGFNN